MPCPSGIIAPLESLHATTQSIDAATLANEN
jgi:hypothetical protein